MLFWWSNIWSRYNFWMVYMQLWRRCLLDFQDVVTYIHYILYFRYFLDSLYSYLLMHLTYLILNVTVFYYFNINVCFSLHLLQFLLYTNSGHLVNIFVSSLWVLTHIDYKIASFNALLPEFSLSKIRIILPIFSLFPSAWYTFLIPLFLAFWMNEFYVCLSLLRRVGFYFVCHCGNSSVLIGELSPFILYWYDWFVGFQPAIKFFVIIILRIRSY